MNRILLAALLALAGAAATAKEPTDVLFFFDAEDFVSNRSHDAIRDLANILADEGVRGNFALSGYLAKKLVDRRRFDVLDALKGHLVGSQTLYHSVHPNLTESTDLADFDAAYRHAQREEAEAAGMIRAATGQDRLWCSVFPGNGTSYVGLYLHADFGIPFFGGCSPVYANDGRSRGHLWYCNQWHLPYHGAFSLENFLLRRVASEEEIASGLDRAAKLEAVVFAMHPCMAVKSEFWDAVNFRGGNLHPWGEWVEAADRDPAETAAFYARLRALIRRLKADGRFRLTDCERLYATKKPRAKITRREIPAIRAALGREFRNIVEPASWSVADCFQAAVRLLRGEREYRPGTVHGFLEKPVGVTTRTTVRREDLIAASRGMDLGGFLPASIRVGGVRIGPADFLFAALETLETGADEVTVRPREQLGDIAKDLPGLVEFRQNANWIYWPAFRDDYLSDRLRLQFWTLRYE